MSMKAILAAALALGATLAAGTAQARDDVQWGISIGSNGAIGGYVGSAPVYAAPVYGAPVYTSPVYVRPAPVYVAPSYRHRASRWDADGDGIPNRRDAVYNPRWDRDGDGIPNRYDRNDNRRWHR